MKIHVGQILTLENGSKYEVMPLHRLEEWQKELMERDDRKGQFVCYRTRNKKYDGYIILKEDGWLSGYTRERILSDTTLKGYMIKKVSNILNI